MTYYNDNNAYAAGWLRNLIKAWRISDGRVDERSIHDVRSEDLAGFVRCHFFAGIAGWDLVLQLAGWPEGRSVWTASLPCQPFSSAGPETGGSDGRHLWPVFFDLVRKCHPSTIFGEQVERAIAYGWLDRVFADLENEGYACGAVSLPACSVGANHIRERLFWVADLASVGRERLQPGSYLGAARQRRAVSAADMQKLADYPFERGDCWPKPLVRRMVDDVPGRVAKLHALGNSIVPAAAAEFVRGFMDCER